VDENEIIKVVYGLGENYQRILRIKRIVTYVADKKRYINIDCSFTKQMSIEEAHGIASKIEEALREHFEETTITVHVEPS
jgi:divalent metal cation (Fe/Co/Zn/Cd) transporter